MPNTASAERRMRNSVRKQQHNRSLKSRLKTLEQHYLELLAAGDKPKATEAFSAISSALDKAAKVRVVHKSLANRKKSRLAVRLGKLK